MFQFLVWPMKAGGKLSGRCGYCNKPKVRVARNNHCALRGTRGRSLGGAPSTSHPETGVVRRSTGDKTCLKPNTKANNER
jgi:hypothetical protein